MLKVDFYDKSASEQTVEIVERKGIGHPDTICDGVAEAVSVSLAGFYLKEFGTILHNNIDKALLAAGSAEKFFGGGRVTKPMELYIGDRATFLVGGKRLDINSLVIETAKNWLSDNLPCLDVDNHIIVKSVLAEGSEELSSIYGKKDKVYSANDTSAAVGYYPLTETEKLVIDLEGYLNSGKFLDTGQDVKVMALRCGKKLDLTVAMPLMAKDILTENQYFERKMAIEEELLRYLSRHSNFESINLRLNTLDKRGMGEKGVYLTITGTSAENADSGEVGRGNKVNGVIPVTRPIGTEAAAGKNPVSHVGKIYNLFSHHLAKVVYENVEGIKEVYVFLLNEIGKPVNSPKVAYVKLSVRENVSKEAFSGSVIEVIEREFSKIDQFCKDLTSGKYKVY